MEISFSFIVSLVSALGGGATVLALVRIMQTRQDTKNTLALTNERELANIRSELWNRIASLEGELRETNQRYDLELATLRSEIDKWQAKYYQVLAVAEQQTRIIEDLQRQIDALEAINNGKETKRTPAD